MVGNCCPLFIMLEEFNPDQIILEQRNLLKISTKDDELVKGINKAISQSNVIKKENDKQSAVREEYWTQGTQAELSKRIHPNKAKTTTNRIWANILTILPYWINKTPEPTPLAEGLTNIQRENIIKACQTAWEVNDDMKWKTQQATLHWMINHIGIIKLRWNAEKQGIETINVLPKKIGFDPQATKMNNCDYIWEMLEDTADGLTKKFPKKKKQIKALVNGQKTKLRYIEFWGDGGKWVAWKLGNIILDKKKNPNFDYEGKNNLFKEPQFPYIILNCFNLGYNLYDDTGLIDQAMSLQDSVNKIERQIIDLNEGQKRVWLGSSEAIGREDFDKIIDRTGDFGVYFRGKIPQGGLQLPLAGKPDASMFNDIEHLLSEIDNVMGVHAALRGQYTPGMSHLGMRGYAMMINQDLAKDLIVSRLEQFAENWFNMYLHLVKVYNSGDIKFRTPEDEITLVKDDIPEGLRIMVKKGSMLPVDRASRAEQAEKLAQMGMIAPADLYNDLGYGDTDKRLSHLAEYQQGEIIPAENTPQGQQLNRVKKLVSSPEFQKLPDIQKQQVIQQARQVVDNIKQPAAQQPPIV